MTVTNTTITGNSAVDGGGIYYSLPFTLVNTIVAGNTAATAPDVDAQGQTVTGGHNLIGSAAGLSGTGISDADANGDIVGHPAMLGTLGNNGGPTQTIPPSPGSPAIGAGGAVTTLTTAAGATDTTLTVADAATIASTAGNFLIQIGGEQMEVTNVDLVNNTLTVTRGLNGTTAAMHRANAGITLATDQRGDPAPSPPDIGAYQLNPIGPIVTWINPNGGNWDVGSNWSTGIVPGSGDDAVINTASPATIAIQSGDNESVLSLTTAANERCRSPVAH